MAPMAPVNCGSLVGAQFAPPSVVFQTPTPALPAYAVPGLPGSSAMPVTRPETVPYCALFDALNMLLKLRIAFGPRNDQAPLKVAPAAAGAASVGPGTGSDAGGRTRGAAS